MQLNLKCGSTYTHQALSTGFLVLGEFRGSWEIFSQLGPNFGRYQLPFSLQNTQTSYSRNHLTFLPLLCHCEKVRNNILDAHGSNYHECRQRLHWRSSSRPRYPLKALNRTLQSNTSPRTLTQKNKSMMGAILTTLTTTLSKFSPKITYKDTHTEWTDSVGHTVNKQMCHFPFRKLCC